MRREKIARANSLGPLSHVTILYLQITWSAFEHRSAAPGKTEEFSRLCHLNFKFDH